MKARWKSVSTDVAVKQMRTSASSSIDRQLHRELRVLRRLRHPNVVEFFGTSSGEYGRVLIVMELVCPGNLCALLAIATPENPRQGQYGPIPMPMPSAGGGAGGGNGAASRVLDYAVDIASALKYLHRNGVVHADLKSANVLIGNGRHGKPCAKLADFGMARVTRDTQGVAIAASSMGGAGGARGTMGWMAPEVMNGEKATEAADMYAYGIVIWELLTGDTPFAGMNMPSMCLAVIIRAERPPLPARCPPALAELVRELWAANPAARPDASEALSRVIGVRNALAVVD